MNTPNTPEQNDSLSLLERRLAEIAARKQGSPADAPASSEAAASATPAAPQAEAPAEAAPAPVPLVSSAAPAPVDTEPMTTVQPTVTEVPSAEAQATVTSAVNEALAERALPPTPDSSAENQAEGEASSEADAAVVAQAPAAAETAAPDVALAAAASTPDAEVAAVEPHEAQSSVTAAADVLTQPATEPIAETAAAQPNAEAAMPVEVSAPAVEAPAAPAMESAAEMPTDGAAASAAERAGSDEETDADADAEDTAAAPVEFDNFESLEAGPMSRLLVQALQRPEAYDQARSLIDRKRQYEARYDQEREEALKRFVAAGGDPGAFDRTDTADHKALETAWAQFRETRSQRRRQEEQQQQQNLERKRSLLEQLRALADATTEENDKVAPKVKTLQNEWRSIGPVPYKESKELWAAYDALLDRFYSQRNLTFELKDLDRRKNLELKNTLVSRAEALAELAASNPGQAARELRALHEDWKHVGPVPQEQREEVWQRFIAASDKVHGRRTEELAGRRATEQESLERKQALLTELEALAEYQSDRIEDWKVKTDELQALKQQWDAAGFVPRAQAQDMNRRFWVLYKGFFQKKGAFFKQLDDERASNVKRKEELIELAESHINNDDYAATRDKYIQWQKEWKGVGPVPERLSQKLWNRFRAACNAFFERPAREVEQRHAAYAAQEAQLNELSAEKNAYLDQLAERMSAAPTDATPGSLEEYKEILASWNKFDEDRAGQGGSRVPVAPRVEERFFSLLSRYLETVPITYSQRQELLFRQSLEQMKGAPDAPQRFAKREQDLRRIVLELENEIATSRTNLGFFARSKNADTLRQEYEGRIQEAESRLETVKMQLKQLRAVAPPLPAREGGRFGDRDNDRRGGGGGRGGFGGGGGGGFGGGRR